MTFQEFDKKLKEVEKRIKKNKKDCKSIMRPVAEPISS